MKNLEEESLRKFIDASTDVRESMRQFIQRKFKKQKIDLTFEMYQVMRVLFEHKNLSQVEIANLLKKDKASITYILDGLAKRGIVIRQTDPKDRRRNIVKLTRNAFKIQSKILSIMKQLYEFASALNDLTLKKITEDLLSMSKRIENK